MPTLTSPGIGSGLDVNGIVQKLMTVEQQPLLQLQQKEAVDQAKISAYGSLTSALSALQSALDGLASAGSFRNVTASVADTTVMSAKAGSGAVPGSYQVEVTKLAQAHKIASAGFTNTTDVVGTGTLTFDFGTFAVGAFTSNGSGAKSVTIDASQNTLAGIRDAVNAAKIGVSATIVNDGSAAGNRLVFTSVATGAANSLKVTVADADGNHTDTSGLSRLAYDPAAAVGAGRNMEEKAVAQDALLTLDGITVHKASNLVTDAIDGVTLTLTKPNIGTPTTLTVATASTGASAAIGAFIKAYNDLDTTFDNLTKYDASKKQASVLTGDSTVRMVQAQLRTLLGGRLGSGAYATLSQVGVSFQSDGTLKLDGAKLDAAIAANPTAVTQLFAAMGTATDALVSVTGFNAKTTPGTYALSLSQLATQATLVGQGAAGLTITAGVNDTLAVLLDGVSATVTLAAGTYANADALAAEIKSKVNGASAISQAGSTVAVTQTAGILTLTSNRFGSASAITVSGTAASGLFGAAPVATAGVDAAGTLDGKTLLGAGRTLQGATGTSLEGLQLQVTGGAIGARGTVTYQTGFAYRLNDLVKRIVASDGVIAARSSGLQKDITELERRKDALNARLTQVEANYRAQFNALDTLLSNLSAQSAALTQQLAALPSLSNTSSNK